MASVGTQKSLEHKTIQVAGDSVQLTAEIPLDDMRYEGIVIIAPGFGGFKRTSRRLRNALAENHIATVSYSPVRNDDHSIWGRLAHSQRAHADTITAVADTLGNDDELASRYPHVNFKRRVLLPHSMGGLATAQHASEVPTTQTDAIINLAAAGFGSPTIPQLAASVPRELPHIIFGEFLPFLSSGSLEITPRNLWRVIHYYGSNPMRTIGEMYACLTTDVRPTVSALGRQGVKSAFIGFEHDALIPPNENAYTSVVDFMAVLPGTGHTAPQQNAPEVAVAVTTTIDELGLAA